MNCQKGDLAYIRVPDDWPVKTLDGKFVTVGVDGECDLGTFAPPGTAGWICEFHVPWYSAFSMTPVHKCCVQDSWLRPIRGVPVDDEVHEELHA